LEARFSKCPEILFADIKKELVRTLDVEKGCGFSHTSMHINSKVNI
jgi:hypothetical protein